MFAVQTIYNNASLSTTAIAVPIPAPVVGRGGNQVPVRRSTAARVVNTHATNLVYVAFDRTASATDYDAILGGNSTVTLALKPNYGYLSIIASAASTPVSINFGNATRKT